MMSYIFGYSKLNKSLQKIIGMPITLKTGIGITIVATASFAQATLNLHNVNAQMGLPQFLETTTNSERQQIYQQIVGAASPFKEGDSAIGVSATDEESRQNARVLLTNTPLKFFHDHPLYRDALQDAIWKGIDIKKFSEISGWTLSQLKNFLLRVCEKITCTI